MKIALVFPQWMKSCGIEGLFAKRSSSVMPLNLAYIAALAEQAGHQVMILDAEAENLSFQDTIGLLKKFGPDYIGLTATTPFFHIINRLLQAIFLCPLNLQLIGAVSQSVR